MNCHSYAPTVCRVASSEDCQVLSHLLETRTEVPLNVATLLKEYNDKRLDDVIAICEISEVAMGGARSIRPAFMARLLIITLLKKTLGRLAPKVHIKCSVEGM